MKKNILVPAMLLAVISIAIFGTELASAQGASQGDNTLVKKIAAKFNLKQEDVQAVFDQDRKDHQAGRETRYTEKLTQDVKDGKITEAQKALILNKRKELETNRQAHFESMKDKTPQERKTAMERERKVLEDWATQNGIDVKYLLGGFGKMRGPGGHGMGMGRHGMSEASPSPTVTQ